MSATFPLRSAKPVAWDLLAFRTVAETVTDALLFERFFGLGDGGNDAN